MSGAARLTIGKPGAHRGRNDEGVRLLIPGLGTQHLGEATCGSVGEMISLPLRRSLQPLKNFADTAVIGNHWARRLGRWRLRPQLAQEVVRPRRGLGID